MRKPNKGYTKMKLEKKMLLTIDDKGCWKFVVLGLMGQGYTQIRFFKQSRKGENVWKIHCYRQVNIHES